MSSCLDVISYGVKYDILKCEINEKEKAVGERIDYIGYSSACFIST